MRLAHFLPFNVLAFVLGSIVGSFLNVVIYRLPRGKSIVSPPSSCPSCGERIKPWHNIPILSYLILRGRCAHCGARISPRYPFVELVTGIFCLATFRIYGLHPAFLVEFIFICLLIVITFIDLDTMTIPDVLSLPGIPFAFFGSVLTGMLTWKTSLVGMLAGGGSFWLLSLIYYVVRGKEGLGGGDVKLMAMIGAYTAWPGVLFTVLFASLAGCLVGIVMMLRKKEGLSTMLPFGPFLALGTLVYLYWGPAFYRWYFSLAAPGR